MKLEWKTEKRKIKDLIPYEQNPRKMDEKQAKELRESIKRFDLVEIPAIDTDNKIIAGHQRITVLLENNRGEEEIDVRVPNRKLTDKEFREYLLRSNKNTGQWDWDVLANFEAEDLKEVGFTSEELDKNFGLVEEDDFDVDKSLGEIKEPICKLGDVYQLGEHRLMCGDSTNKDHVEILMNNAKAKCLFTSPPYNMNAEMYENYEDNLKSKEYIDFNINVAKVWISYLKGYLFWNISYNKNSRWEFIEIMSRLVKESGLRFMELIVWNKKHALPITSKDMLTRQYEDIILLGDQENINQDMEMIWLGSTEKRGFFNKTNGKGITNYWEIDTSNSQLDNHKACFPVRLPAKAIKLVTNMNDIVVDCFGGSGSTLIACEQTNRKCYMMELSEKYCDVIIKRWEQFTNKKAIKL